MTAVTISTDNQGYKELGNLGETLLNLSLCLGLFTKGAYRFSGERWCPPLKNSSSCTRTVNGAHPKFGLLAPLHRYWKIIRRAAPWKLCLFK